ncbi:Hsp33 family molecular chaperone [Kaustia mangrovi]|uniref:Hsp33 family molecular chaperone n=1 Tax=Kaustia mangrovi TaxID=2593653 RepID=A0A7S8HCF9_9HYPH|nr:Hsp33 family molecular chaperone [Kaustia mangrovi]QPC43575.1 Hsp33 family molecular chaperone [Kaustia mangrovi]
MSSSYDRDRRLQLLGMADDAVLPFEVKSLGVRGRVVRLGDTVADILARHNYPPSVSALLAEAVTLTAMLGSTLKFEGKFILQANSDGPVDMLVADFTTPGQMRGYAHFDLDAVEALEDSGEADASALLGEGYLAMTVDQGDHMERYQGVVPLDGASLSEAANLYFQQSEQLPTDVRLAAGPIVTSGEAGGENWRAGGIMIQHLPDDGEPSPIALSSGDVPEDYEDLMDEQEEDDRWVRGRLLLATVEDHELLDPTLEPERLLYRLFHEDGVVAYPSSAITRHCLCSRSRVADLLRSFPQEDLADMIEDGRITVTCEFCSTDYVFDPGEIVRTH